MTEKDYTEESYGVDILLKRPGARGKTMSTKYFKTSKWDGVEIGEGQEEDFDKFYLPGYSRDKGQGEGEDEDQGDLEFEDKSDDDEGGEGIPDEDISIEKGDEGEDIAIEEDIDDEGAPDEDLEDDINRYFEGEDDQSKGKKKSKQKKEVTDEYVDSKISDYEGASSSFIRMAKNLYNALGMDFKSREGIKKIKQTNIFKADDPDPGIIIHRGKMKVRTFKGKTEEGKPWTVEIPFFEKGESEIKVVEDMPYYPNVSYSPEKRILDNEFNTDFPFGQYVSFIDENDNRIFGIVTSWTQYGAMVNVKGDEKFLPYEDLTIEEKPLKNNVFQQEFPKVRDLYDKPVPENMRSFVVNTYTSLLKDIIVEEPSTEKAPQPKKIEFSWDILNNPPKSWEVYYAENLFEWILSKNREKFYNQLDIEALKRKADKMAAKEADEDFLLNQIVKILPSGLNSDVTAFQIITAIQHSSPRTVFQVRLIDFLERRFGSQLDVKGNDLAVALADCITSYRETFKVPDADTFMPGLVEKSIRDIALKYKVLKSEKAMFDASYLKNLQDLHKQSTDAFDKAKKAYQKSLKKGQQEQNGEGRIEPKSTEEYIRERVKIFELNCYSSSTNVLDYLTTALIPYIFLEGALSPFASFFRAKISSQKFDFAALSRANLAHYLPEFSMKALKQKKGWEEMAKIILTVLESTIDSFISKYYTTVNPSMRIDPIPEYNQIDEDALAKTIGTIDDSLKRPKRDAVKDGKYVYKVKEGRLQKEVVDVPLEDLVICYDEKKDVFTGHDVKDVIKQISEAGDNTDRIINPYTGNPYSKVFIKNIKSRYEGTYEPPMDLTEEEKKKLLEEDKAKKEQKERSERESEDMPAFGGTKKLTKVIRERPKPVKVPAPIKALYLLGDDLEDFLFDESLEIPLANGGTRKVPLTGSFLKKSVTVLTVKPDSDLNTALKERMDGVTDKIYVICIGAVSDLQKKKLVSKIKTIVPDFKDVYYAEDDRKESIADALIDIVVREEGIQVKG